MKSITLLLLGTLAAAPAFAAPVGMVASVKGGGTVSQEGETKPLRMLHRLEPGATVKTAAGGEAVIVLFGSSDRFKLSGGKTATVSATGVTGAQKLAALSGPSANAVKLLGHGRVGAVMARLPGKLQRLSNAPNGYTSSTAPQFSWAPMGNGRTYTFALLDSGDNVVWSTRTTDTTVTYPADGLPLQERRPYLWRVTAFATSGKPADVSSGLITFLSPQDMQSLATQLTELEPVAKVAPDNEALLTLIALYQDFGIYNRLLELFDLPLFKTDPGLAQIHEDTYAGLSPLTRILAGQSVQLLTGE